MDEQIAWFEAKITSSLRPRGDEIKAFTADIDSRANISNFCSNEDCRCLFVYQLQSGLLQSSLSTPEETSVVRCLTFVKLGLSSKLDRSNWSNNVAFFDNSVDVLENINWLSRELYLPTVSHEENNQQHTVIGAGKKSIFLGDKYVDLMHRFLASSEFSQVLKSGDVQLPYPSLEVLQDIKTQSKRSKSITHIIETTIINWTKQLKVLLKVDPLDEVHRHSLEMPVGDFSGIPCVVHEEALWHERVISLRKIEAQLHSEVTMDLVAYLEQQNNKYASGVHEMRKDLQTAVSEALDNIRFLKPLQCRLEEIALSDSVEEVKKLYKPLIHTLQLVWEHSAHYHKRTYFHNLVTLVVNQMTLKASSFVSSDLLEDTKLAFQELKFALNLCGNFRGSYLDKKAKTDVLNQRRHKETRKEELRTPKTPYYRAKIYPPTEKYDLWTQLSDGSLWSDSPWPEKNSPSFDKLNAFSERCNDLLDFVETIHQFRLMRKVAEVGGAGSHGLDALVSEIHEQFEKAMKSFAVSHNDLLGLKRLSQAGSNTTTLEGEASFEQQFFNFRLVIRNLEKRLASVLSQSFLQCGTIGSQLRILEVFEGVNNREVIQKAIEREDREMVSCFLHEMMTVKDMLDQNRNSVPEHVNVPLIVSKLKWQHALQQRIQVPMGKLKKVSPNSLMSSEGQQIEKLFGELSAKLEKFRDKLLKDWQRGLNPEIKERLKDFILISPLSEDHELPFESATASRALVLADRESALGPSNRAATSGADLSEILRVNLDQSLLMLLREVHYLAQPPFEVRMPDTVKEIIRSMDFQTLRSLSARLEAIVAKYNYVMRSITREERALFHRKLTIIEQLLDQGKTAYTWKMAETQDFIEHASQLVLNDLYYNLDKVKSNLKEIFDIFNLWSDGPLDVFHDRDSTHSYSMQELMDEQSTIVCDHDAYLRSSGLKVHSLLEDTFSCVEVSRGSPAWEEYLNNVDQYALKALHECTFASLRHMYNELADANNSEPKGEPLLVIKLGLVDGRLGFKPPLDKSSDETSVQEAVEEWVSQFLNRGSYIQPVFVPPAVGGGGEVEDVDEYHKRIAADVNISDYIEKIDNIVEANCQDCKSLVVPFNDFYFLWTDDIPTVFHEFLSGKLQPYPLREEVKGYLLSDQATAAKSSRSDKTMSESSNSKSKRSSAPGFHTAKKMTDRIFEHMPSLDAFETEIEIYKIARMRVEEFENFFVVGWLKIDCSPIKEVLKGYANKAIWTYTDYLIEQVSAVLTSLDSFLRRIEPELEQVTGNEQEFDEIMRIMHIFNEVSSQHAELDSKFTAMQRTVALVRKHGLGIRGSELPRDLQKAFATAPQRWSNLKSKVTFAKQRLTPNIHNQSEFITGKLQEFGHELRGLESEIAASVVYQRNCPTSSAFDLIQQFHQKLQQLNLRAQDLYELQELLQIPAVDFKVLNRVLPDMKEFSLSVKKELENLSSIWEMAQKVNEWKQNWLNTCWFSMDTFKVANSAATLEQALSQYPEQCQSWDITESLIVSVTMIKGVLPLVDDLSNSAMRARHWKQLYRETKSSIQIDQDNVRYMTLGKLLNTNLHVHSEDIRKIVSRAQGDLTIEQMLKRFEEIWLGKVFTMKEHVKSSMEQKDFLDAPDDDAFESGNNSKRSSRRTSRDKVMSIAAPADDGGSVGSRSRANTARLTTPGRAKRISLSSLPMEITNMQTEFNLDQLVAQMLDKPSVALNQVLQAVKDNPMEFSQKMFLLAECDEVFEKLESHQMDLERMRQNKDAGSFLDEIIKWQSILQDIESVVKVWLKAQNLWLKLDEIFAKSEMGIVLPKESILFSTLNKNFRILMKATAHKPNILQCCFYKGIRKTLEKMSENFEFCHSSLLRNLEKRRSRFARFYFLSDEDVITIIANGSDLNQVKHYMYKVYDNVGSLIFDTTEVEEETSSSFRITHLMSKIGEPLELVNPIVCKGETEKWLNEISYESKSTLKAWIRSAFEVINLEYWKQDRDSIIGGKLNDTTEQNGSKAIADVSEHPDYQEPNDGIPQIEINRSAGEEKETSKTEAKSFVEIPSEVMYLALNCDLTNLAKIAMERRNEKHLGTLVTNMQRGLDKISQLIISLEEMKRKRQKDTDLEDMSIDEMDNLESAFHGAPEIEATATMTELIQLENELSEDPQPTNMQGYQMPRKTSEVKVEETSIQLASPEQAVEVPSQRVHQLRSSSEGQDNRSISPSKGNAENQEFDKESPTGVVEKTEDQNILDENLSDAKSASEQKDAELEASDQDPELEKSEENIIGEDQRAESSDQNVVQPENDLENGEQNKSSIKNEREESVKGSEGRNEQEVHETSKAETELDLPPLPPRTSSVHRHSRKDASLLSKYYDLAMRPYQMKKLEGVINLLITWRDRIERALDCANKNLLFTFYWQQMMKFYCEPLNTVAPIKIECFGEVVGEYQFDYQGSSVKQTVSGQTEKTLINMALSMSHFRPTIVAAPSGSSKRETVKELSKTFGQALFPLTCTSFTTSQTLESVLKGVALSGLWVTIHNVNHLKPSLVVLLGKMIHSLIDAVKNKKAEMDLKPFFYPIKSFNNPGVFCTIDDKVEITSSNPDRAILRSSSLLALPPSVVSQFRQVALSCPDLKSSYEASLISKGFTHANSLARKLSALSGCRMDIDEKIATVSSHFWADKFWPGPGWAPSLTENILEMARTTLEEMRKSWKLKNETDTLSDDEQTLLEVQALAVALKTVFVSRHPGSIGANIFKDKLLSVMPEAENVPMTLQEQSARFQNDNNMLATIQESLDLSFDRGQYSRSNQEPNQNLTARSEIVERLGLASSPYFLTRIQQLADICSTHNFTIVSGRAGSGKSSVIKCYSGLLESQGCKVSTDRLVVGTLETHELFGYYTSSNFSWFCFSRWVDGGFNTLVRSYAHNDQSGSDSHSDPTRFLVMDGNINERQMEIFGSVLHSNGKLTFANNESFELAGNIKIFWEIDSLAQLSPSVLTHAPVLSLNQSELTYQMVTSVWLNNQWVHYKPSLQKFIETYVPKLLEHSAKMLKGPLEGGTDRVSNQIIIREALDSVQLIDKVRTMLRLIDGSLGSFRNAGEQILERFFCFSAIWAFGGLFAKESRNMFSEWWHSTFCSSPVPIKGTVWDYYVDSETCDWARYDENLPPYSAPSQCGIAHHAFVPTVSTQQLSNLVGLAQESGAPVMLVGEHGCGKTSVLMDKLRGPWSNDVSGIKATKHSAANRTNAKSLWSVLRENLEWKYGNNFVPRGNKQLICFIDDINMSEIDSFGNQSACEFIRQHLDCDGVFDPESMKWRSLSKTQYVTTVNPALSSQKLSPRLLRHFMIFNCPYPNNSDIQTIFKTLLMNHFLPFDLTAPVGTTMSSYRYNQEKRKVENLLSTTVAVTTEVHNRLRSMFLPTVQRAHYVFTVRDIRTIFTNVCLSLRPHCDRKDIILLWEHENQWVFGRRLIDHVDYDRYQKVFTTAARKEFSNDEDLDSLIETEVSRPTFSSLEETLSGVVIAGPQPGTVSRDGRFHDNYRAFEDVDEVKGVLKESIKEFNKSKPNIRVPLYKSTVEEVCRIARMLHSPHNVGHALLVADGSPGVIMLIVSMAAHLSNYTLFQIRPSHLAAAAASTATSMAHGRSEVEYNLEHFRREISTGYKRAGVNNEKILLMVTLHETSCEDQILSHLQELIVQGPPVNSLFSPEEQTSIVNSIRSAVIQSGLPYSRRTAWDFFLENVRTNFRVVLVTSASKHAFQRRCITFPHLTTHMNIIFFSHWKLQQLIEVANYHVDDEDTAHVLANMHLAIRQQDGAEKNAGEFFTLTNTTYEKFIERFVYLRKRRETEIRATNEKVEHSLRNIAEGNDVILKLKKSLEHERSVMKSQVEGTIKLMGQIGEAKAIARQNLVVLYKQHDKLINLRKALPEFRLAYERACYKTEKLYSETVKLVHQLDNVQLGELRAMPKPDQEVQDLLATIIKILKAPNSDSTWAKGAKRQMANLERFKEELLRFEQEPMKKATLEMVEPLVNKPSFTPDQMTMRANDNKAAGDLAQWVLNVIQFNKLKYEKVRPLKEKVDLTGEELREAEGKMVSLESRRGELEQRLRELAKNYEKATVDKNNQQEATVNMDQQVDEATQFGLVMMHQVDVCQSIQSAFEERQATVCGSIALCAAFAAYLGPYGFNFRASMMLEHWPNCLTQRGIPVQFDVIDPLNGRYVEYSFNDEMFDASEGDEDEANEFIQRGHELEPTAYAEKSQSVLGGDDNDRGVEFEMKFGRNESAQNMATPPNEVGNYSTENNKETGNFEDTTVNSTTMAENEAESSERKLNLSSVNTTKDKSMSDQNRKSSSDENTNVAPNETTKSSSDENAETSDQMQDGDQQQQRMLVIEQDKSQTISSKTSTGEPLEQNSRLTPLEERNSGAEDVEGGDRKNMVMDIEQEHLDRYQMCIKAVVKMLIGEDKLNHWLAAGYTLSQIENAAIVLAFGHVRPPLIIDPDGEAEQWICNSFQNIKSISLARKDPNSKLEIMKALKEGREEDEDEEEEAEEDERELDKNEGDKENDEDADAKSPPATLVITGVSEPVDSLLGPLILNKNMQREEAKWEEPGLMSFDGHLMVCNEDYSLLMTCDDKTVKFNSNLASVTTLVSYVPNELSLYQKLLDLTFQYLHPRVAAERGRVLRSWWRCQQRIRQLEQTLYHKLTNFSGDNVWAESTVVKSIVETMDQINDKMEAYRLVLDRQESLRSKLSAIAERAASFFYLIQNLDTLSPSYNFSLKSLVNTLRQVLKQHRGTEAEAQWGEQEEGGDELSLHEQFISTKGTRAVESDDEDEDNGSTSGSNGKSDDDGDDSSTDEQADGDSAENVAAGEDDFGFAETEQVLRLQSADYSSQPGNRVKKIENELTEKLFAFISKSLTPEHRLIFSAFLALKMKWSDITNDEIIFLFYGNLQERMDSKGLEDFGISATLPDWLPKDRFDDVITVSLLQDSPLNGLCREVVEHHDEWKDWFMREQCESFPMPRDNDEDWKDIHKLIVIRLLRPDRFCAALKLFAQDNLPIINDMMSSNADEKPDSQLLDLIKSNPGFVVSLPGTGLESTANLSNVEHMNIEDDLVERIEKLAELAVDEQVKVSVIDPVTAPSTTHMLEMVERKLGQSRDADWVVVRNFSSTDTQFLQRFFYTLVHVTQSEVKNCNCKLWLLGEPKAEFNIPNSVNLCAISYDTMLGKPKFGVDLIDATTQSSDGSELNLKPEFLSQAIRQSVKMIPDDVWNRVNSSNPTIRNSVLALCVINGILVAKQCLSTQGLSKVYALLGQELLQAVEKFLSSVGPNDSGSSSLNKIIDDDSMTVMRGTSREKASEELVEFLVQHVYGRLLSNESDFLYVKALLLNAFVKSDLKERVNCLRLYSVPLPPANLTDKNQVGEWFVDKCEWGKFTSAAYLDVSSQGLNAVCRTKNESTFKWISTLGSVYRPLVPGAFSGSPDLENEVTQARMSIDLCYDHLPSLLNVAEDETSLFVEPTVLSFPYHPPSRFSSTVISSAESGSNHMMSMLLQQECLFFNEWLCFIRQSLHQIEASLLRGIESLPPHLQTAAHSLAKEEVPLSWLSNCHTPSTHTLYSFLKNLTARHEQFSDWLRRGVVASKRNPNPNGTGRGALKEIWLGGLVNPTNVLCCLKSTAANKLDCLIDEIVLDLDFSTELYQLKPLSLRGNEDDPTIVLRYLYLEGSTWGLEESRLRTVGVAAGPVPMPAIVVKAVKRKDWIQKKGREDDFYNCPVFTNKSRASFVTNLNLPCENNPSVFSSAGLTSTCLLLDAGPEVVSSSDSSLSSKRMRLAHIKSIPKDIPDETHSDIISTARTKLTRGESLQDLINSIDQKEKPKPAVESEKHTPQSRSDRTASSDKSIKKTANESMAEKVSEQQEKSRVQDRTSSSEGSVKPGGIVVDGGGAHPGGEGDDVDESYSMSPGSQKQDIERQGEQFESESQEFDDLLSPNEAYKTHLDFPIASPDTIDPTSPANDTPRSQKAEPPQAIHDTPKSESRGQHNESTEKQPENYEEQSDSRDVSKGGDESSGRVSERPRSESKTESEKGSFKNQTDNNPLKSDSRLLEQIINEDP